MWKWHRNAKACIVIPEEDSKAGAKISIYISDSNSSEKEETYLVEIRESLAGNIVESNGSSDCSDKENLMRQVYSCMYENLFDFAPKSKWYGKD